MIKRSNNTKKLGTIALAGSFLATSFAGMTFYHNPVAIYAESFQLKDLSSTVSNLNFTFTSGSSTDYLKSPDSWTQINPDNLSTTDDITVGVMDTSNTSAGNDYEDMYNLSKEDYPGYPTLTNVDYAGKYTHLMINAKNNSFTFGYKSSTFDLHTESYYSIIVTAAATDGATGYIALEGFSDGTVYKLPVSGDWADYTFFIQTSTTMPENITVNLYLGDGATKKSTGAVFFNRVQWIQYNESNYYSIKNSTTNNSEEISLIKQTPTVLYNFDSGTIPSGFDTTNAQSNYDGDITTQLFGVYAIGDSYDNALKTLNISNPYSTGLKTSSHALLMYNKNADYMDFTTSNITLESSKSYRLSLWAYSDCKTGEGATITLKTPNSTQTASLTTETSLSSVEANNGWKEYVFYITSSPTEKMTVQLNIALGTSENPTNGYVWLDDIRLQEINAEDITNADGSNESSTTYAPFSSSSTSFTNGEFNNFDNNGQYPYSIKDWTLGADNDDTLSTVGIVNVNNWSSLNGIFNPQSPKNSQSDNLLMLQNTFTTKTSITSPTITLSANSYYCVSFDVNTAELRSDSGLDIVLSSTTNTVCGVNDVYTNGVWKTYKLYFKTGKSSDTVSFTLSLDKIGYAFFDNFDVVTYTASSDTNETPATFTYNYNNDLKNTRYVTKLIDNTTINFDNYVENSQDKNGYYTPTNWTGTQKGGERANAGVVTTGDKNRLVISSSILGDTYYQYQYNYDFTLSPNAYYKIAVTLRTENINQLEENKKYDDDGNLYECGATISLTNFDKYFSGIDTRVDGDGSEINETYYFFINPDSESDITSKLTISLGNENALTSGSVIIDSVEFVTYDGVDSFNEAQKGLDANNTIVVTAPVKEETPDDDATTDETPTNNNNVNWFILPTIITALAIFIAVLGAAIRQMSFTRKPKIKTSYDRRKTVETRMDREERINLRKEIISELSKEMADIEDQINAIKSEFAPLEEKSIQEHTALIEAFRVEKENIKQEHEQVVKEYKERIEKLSTQAEKDHSEREFARYIRKLQAREDKINEKLEAKNIKLERLQKSRDERIARYLERQLLIKQEIERVEAEIEQIAREDAKIWEEYKQQKAEAKQKKQQYREDMKKYKEYQKSAKTKKKENSSHTEQKENEKEDSNNDNAN